MPENEVVKMGLIQVHAMLDEVQEMGDRVMNYWAEVKSLAIGHPLRESAIDQCARLAERSMDLVTKAGVLSNCLCSLLPDRRAHNAVLQNALNELSRGYAKLLQVQKALDQMLHEVEK